MLRAADAIDGTRCYISGSGTGGWGRIRCGCHDMDAIDETTFGIDGGDHGWVDLYTSSCRKALQHALQLHQ